MVFPPRRTSGDSPPITVAPTPAWQERLPVVLVGALGALLGLYALRVASLSGGWGSLLIVATLLPLVVIIAGQPRRLLLAIILLELPFNYDIHLFYREEQALRGAIGGLNVSVTTFAMAALYGLWLWDTVLKRGTGNSLSTVLRTNLSLLLYVAVAAASILVAQDRQLAAFEVVMLVQLLLLYIYVVHWMRTREDVLFVVTLVLAGLVLESFVMLLLPLLGESVSVLGMMARIDEGRVAGTIGASNTAGAYLSLALAMALAVLVSGVTRPYKVLAGFAMSLGVVALILTGSRGGWIGLVVTVSVLSLFALRNGWISPFAVVGGLLFVLFFGTIFVGLILPRVWSPESAQAALGRIPLMELTGRMIGDNPLLGVGANNFSTRMGEYATAGLQDKWLYTVHNKFLLVWAETGLFALIAFVGFLVVTIRRGWRKVCENDAFLSPIALGLMAGIVGRIAHMLVDIFNGRTAVEFLWLVAAILAAMDLMQRRTPEPSLWVPVGDEPALAGMK